MNSITKRGIKGSLLIIIALLVMASAFMLLTFRNSYYSAAQTALSNRINTINGTLNASGRMSATEREELFSLEEFWVAQLHSTVKRSVALKIKRRNFFINTPKEKTETWKVSRFPFQILGYNLLKV